MAGIKVAILTVSDTASANSSADRSGPAIRNIFAERGHQCTTSNIVPDDEHKIQETVRTWADAGIADLIVSTGGTGFGVRDRTPEALRPLLEREAPGIVHLLISSSLRKTVFAALARPVAGTIKNTLVIALPGSVRAITENLEALLDGGVLDHAIELIRGGSGKKLHAQLAAAVAPSTTGASGQQHEHHHHHHHHHGEHSHSAPKPRTTLSHDPTQPVSARHRVSPYPLCSLEFALTTVLCEVRTLDVEERPIHSALRGYVLAEDVHAPHDVPASPTTNVDGYAVRSTDPPGIYKVLTPHTLPAGDTVPAGHIYRINTGAPLPPGTDAILMVEDTQLHSTTGEEEEHEVEALAQVDKGENVRNAGSDARAGDLVLEKGTVVHAHGGEIGTLAFVGRTKVKVYRKPVVAVLSTGNELLDVQAPNKIEGDGWGGVWDTNRPSLQAALEGLGYSVLDLGIVLDDLDSHVRALQRGLREADLVLTTGGTSMGASDLLKPVIERHLGGTIHFGRVQIKPGKPTTFATVPTVKNDAQASVPVFALPGNPASALVTFHVFVIPALRKLGGWSEDKCHLPKVKVKTQHLMPLDPRIEFHRVTICAEEDGLKAYSTGGQRSSRVASLAGANGLVQLPMATEDGPKVLKQGELVDAIVIGELLTKHA